MDGSTRQPSVDYVVSLLERNTMELPTGGEYVAIEVDIDIDTHTDTLETTDAE